MRRREHASGGASLAVRLPGAASPRQRRRPRSIPSCSRRWPPRAGCASSPTPAARRASTSPRRWSRAWPCSTTTATAGSTSTPSTARRCPASRRRGPSTGTACSATTATGSFTDVTAGAGVAGPRLRPRRRDRRLRQRRATPTSSWPACGGTRSSATTATAPSPTSPSAAGLARPDPKHGTLWAVAAAFVDYDRDGLAGPVRLQLLRVGSRRREPVCGNPGAPDYCHPRQYQGLPNSLFRNNGDGTFTRRLGDVGHPRARRQGHGHRRRRLRRRRLDGPVRVERHGAVVPVHEQPQRHVHGVRVRAGGRVPRAAARPSRAWAPTRATWTTTAGPTSSRPRSRTRPSRSSGTWAARSFEDVTAPLGRRRR